MTTMRTKNNARKKPSRTVPGGLFCPQKPPLTEGKVSTGVGVMSYFGGNSLSQNLTVLPAPS